MADERMERLKQSVALLPELPGVYQFVDISGTVIYVGKAKSLKKRVASYFLNAKDKSRKTAALVRKIEEIRHTVVETESDAFLLENNMIKSLQPKYNILLKDDKTYPWIVVRKEPFPRILSTRNVVRDGSLYFGPYASVSVQRSVLELVRRLYFIRTCSLRLSRDSIRKGKFSKCLEYHIGNCKAPCEGFQSEEEYEQAVVMARRTLRGDLSEAMKYLRDEMARASQELCFEEAQRFKDRVALLQQYQSKSVVVKSMPADTDVFSLVIDHSSAYCNYLHLSKGAIIYAYTIELKLRLEESPQQILEFAIARILEELGRELSGEVIVPFEVDSALFGKSVFTVPKRGDKLKLLQLSEKNGRIYRLEKLKNLEKTSPQKHSERIVEGMRRDLHMEQPPRHIECFDNSNIQGSYPVAACVVFRDAKPCKKDYRHFNIKTVAGIDDFASMKEVITRRYTGMMERQEEFPQLIVVDGGKGQLSAAYGVLCELGLEHRIAMIGLAKRMEEVFFPGDPYPLCLDKNSETLKVLMNIRDEAHRFGITFHRNKRSAGAIDSVLSKIPSLGEKSVLNLLRQFGTAKAVAAASAEELSEVVGARRAEAVKAFFDALEQEKTRVDSAEVPQS